MEANFSTIYFALIAIIAGLTMLVVGGELLVAGAVRLARRLGMSSLVIGLTVVAFGTSTPELFVSLSANLQNQPDIMVGNVVGSNIANIGLILGCCALVRPLGASFTFIANELAWVLAASLALVAFVWLGFFGRGAGLLFVVALILFTFVSVRSGRSAGNGEEKEGGSNLTALCYCLAGFVFLAYGSNVFIKGAVDMALYFKVSSLVIGLTMAAVGTSLPELAASISAGRRGESGLLLGNIVGSNLFNLLMVLGVAGLVKPFALQSVLLVRDLPVMILFSVVLASLLYFRGKIQRWHGLMLLATYGGYIFLLK